MLCDNMVLTAETPFCPPHVQSAWTSERRPIPGVEVFYMVRTCPICGYKEAEDDLSPESSAA